MEWNDRGIVIGVHRHGEHDARLELLTAAHGRSFGIVKGGLGRRLRGILQPGNRVQASWRARIESQLGTFSVEGLGSHNLALSREPGRLLALTAALALASVTLPERELHQPVHDGLEALIDLLDGSDDSHQSGPVWGTGLARWELGLLRDLGFGLDLTACAATGVTQDLTHISPKSGRAVSRAAAQPYLDRLLVLPRFLTLAGSSASGMGEIRDGLTLSAFFLDRYILAPHNRQMPLARMRLAEYVAAAAGRDIL